MRRRLILSLIPALALVVGCGDDTPSEFDTVSPPSDGSGTATDTGAPADLPETGGQDAGTETGDGDGDPGDGDGDGDGDPTTTGGSVCGDGMVSPGEQCDGDDLNGETCESLGYASGMLACDPVTCTYDASACMVDMDGGSGGTTG